MRLLEEDIHNYVLGIWEDVAAVKVYAIISSLLCLVHSHVVVWDDKSNMIRFHELALFE